VKLLYPLLCVALIGLPALAHSRSPADPDAVVPMVPYRSVFTDTPRGVESDTVDWKAANMLVGQFLRGHIDILKWEAAQREGTAPATPTATEASKP